MIDIPTEALTTTFNQSFVPGSVWLYKNYYFRNTGEIRDKYIIVLIAKAADDKAYFLLPSSQVAKVTKNRLSDSFVISKGLCACFPEETVVDVSNIQSESFDRIVNAYIKNPFPHKIEYKGHLDSGLFNQLCSMVKQSQRVAPRLLRQIFPSN